MAHEIEMVDGRACSFSVKETPWHGLGLILGEAPTTEAAIKLAGLDWTVRTEELFTKDQRKAPAMAIIRDSDDKFLGVGGKNYHALQNKHAFEWFDPFIDSKMATLETAGSLRGGQVVWVLARIILGGADIKIVGDDTIRKYILLTSAHDGRQAVRAGFSPVRVVCMNTLRMAVADGDAEKSLIKVCHTKGIRVQLEKAREIMNLANQKFEMTADGYRQLTKKNYTEDSLDYYVKTSMGYDRKLMKLKRADPKAELPKTSQDVVARIKHLVETGYGHDLPGVAGTWWSAYNGVTQYLSHDYGNSDEARYTNLWLGSNATINQRALNTALVMASA